MQVCSLAGQCVIPSLGLTVNFHDSILLVTAEIIFYPENITSICSKFFLCQEMIIKLEQRVVE